MRTWYVSCPFSAQLLGFRNYILPYARARGGRALLEGANYASGASGIRDETGNNLVCNAILYMFVGSKLYLLMCKILLVICNHACMHAIAGGSHVNEPADK